MQSDIEARAHLHHYVDRVIEHLLSRQTGHIRIVSICRDEATALDSLDAATDMAASVRCEENHIRTMVKSDTGFVD